MFFKGRRRGRRKGRGISMLINVSSNKAPTLDNQGRVEDKARDIAEDIEGGLGRDPSPLGKD